MNKEYKFTQIIKDHEGVIFKITTIYTNNSEDQKDLYQEIVYQLWKAYDSFRGDSKISTWMYRVGLNTAISRLKKEKRKGNETGIDKVIMRQSEHYDTEFEERLKKLYAHIHNLNELDKGLMLLLLEGKKYEEISRITGLSPSNVGTKIARIKQKLKSQIVRK
jgi:RNA polymerase sigma-70 factor (ECF subfamily)